MKIDRLVRGPTVAKGVIWCAAATLAIGASAAQAQITSVTVLRIDGRSITGSWVGVRNGDMLSVRDENGATDLPLSEVQRIVFPPPPGSGTQPSRERDANDPGEVDAAVGHDTGSSRDAPQPAERVVLFPSAGGRLAVRSLRGGEIGLTADTVLGDGIVFPLDRLAGVQLAADPTYKTALNEFEEALRNRRPAEDVLISRDADEPKVLRGRIERFGDSDVTFRFAGQSRTAQFDRLFGVVFATGGAKPAMMPAFFELSDGSTIAGRILDADSKTIRCDASFRADVSLAIASIRLISIRSDRVVYVSELPVANERREGILHRPWPIRLDTNLRGDPIMIGGRQFERGVACHSRTELTYKLDEPYAAFAATIGLDDLVRPRGSVVFRLLGNGETLFDSGLITGSDEPRDIFVRLAGVMELTLVVDYGEGLDLADHAGWGGARLIRPSRNEPGVQ